MSQVIRDFNFSGFRIDPEILESFFRAAGFDQLVLDDIARGRAVRIASLNSSNFLTDPGIIADLEKGQNINNGLQDRVSLEIKGLQRKEFR